MAKESVLEREMPSRAGKQKGIKVGSVWMSEETARILAETDREHGEYLQKRQEEMNEVKKSGKKEIIDPERFIRIYYKHDSEGVLNSLLTDQELLEHIEMDYYLDTPDEVATLENYFNWRLNHEG